MSDWTPPEKLGKYDLVSPLGQGGMGVVWRARQVDLGRDVAIKIMLSGEHASEEMLERFRREARLAAKLQDPGIVHVFDYGNEGRLHYFVMELVEGQSLKELIAKGPLPVDRAVRIAADAAKALGAAHDAGVVHRDVKPGNLLIDTKGRVRVADFGLAKDLSDASLTATGTVVGTPSYMAPEQAAGEISRISPRTDVYALGAVLYEMLTGRPPFTGTALAVLRQIDSQAPTPLSKLNPAVPSAVEAVVMRALEKEPEPRFANGKELAMALENPSSMAPTMVRPSAARKRVAPAPVRPPVPSSSRMRWLFGLAVAAAVIVLVSVLGKKTGIPYVAPGMTTPAAQVPPNPTSPPPVTPPQAGTEAITHVGLRRILDRLAKDPLRWAAAGAMPLPTIEEIDAATKEEPDANRRDLLRALALVYSGAKDEALAAAETASNKAPKGNADAALVRGEVLLLAHRWTEESKPLEDALAQFAEVTPADQIDVAILRAVVLISRRDVDGAEDACRHLLMRDQGSPRLHFLLAFQLQAVGKYSQASREASKALGLGTGLDDYGYGAYLDWYAAFDHRRVDGMDEQVLLEHTRDRPWPLAHLLRAWVRITHSDWEGVSAEMKSYEQVRPRLWPALEPYELHALAEAGTLPPKQAFAGLLTFLWLGRWDDAIAAGARAVEASKDIDDAQQREDFVRDTEYQLARACVGKRDLQGGLAHVEACLAHGGRKDFLETESELGELRADPRWRSVIDKAK